MRPVPLCYALFCLAVLSLYTYAKVQGIALASSGTTSTRGTSSSGGHGTGIFLGAHK